MKEKIADLFGALLQSEISTKILQNENLQNAFVKAFTKSAEMKQVIENRMSVLVDALHLVGRESFDLMKNELAELRSQIVGHDLNDLTARLTRLEDAFAAFQAQYREDGNANQVAMEKFAVDLQTKIDALKSEMQSPFQSMPATASAPVQNDADDIFEHAAPAEEVQEAPAAPKPRRSRKKSGN